MDGMKPILFNSEMVRAILAGRKSVTRRVVKPQPPRGFIQSQEAGGQWFFNDKVGDNDMMEWWPSYKKGIVPPYRPDDILYVRETWAKAFGVYWYRADKNNPSEPGQIPGMIERTKWHPSIHMPKEAARIFLRVTGVAAKRVQNITDEDARKEGCADREDFHRVWNNCYAKPRPIKDKSGAITHYESYPWEGICETRTYRGKLWYVIENPWVWVIELEQISKGDALKGSEMA